MKRIALILTIASTALLGGLATAKAQSVQLGVGPGGAYVDVGPRYDRYRHWDGPYAYSPRRCHWERTRYWSHRRDRWVTKRERVCW
jgi:hypothetical protein